MLADFALAQLLGDCVGRHAHDIDIASDDSALRSAMELMKSTPPD